jgi:hypothetical protein
MYTHQSPILYSEEPRGEHIFGQHPKCLHILLRSKRSAVRFLLWWLFLHRRLRSRQRGSKHIAMSGIAPFWRFLSKRHRSFLSEQLEKVLRLFSASLSASTQGVNNNYFPHFVALKQCVTASVCLSLCRSNARKQI